MNGKPHRFARLRLENWRNFRLADVALQQRAFLVGPNASGKSNLLDAFRFLRDLASEGGGFREAVGSRGGVKALRCLAARRRPEIGILATAVARDGTAWDYEIRFTNDNSGRPILRSEVVRRDGVCLLERPDREDAGDPARLSQTYLEQVNVNRAFRELARFFADTRYLHLVPQLVRDPLRSPGVRNDPYGADFLEQVAKTQERTRTARFRKIQAALQVAVPQLREIQIWRDEATGTPHLRGRYEHWRPSGAWQSEDQFSDGTLRLLGLLWAMLDGSGVLLLEEPELSLHPEIVRLLPQLFARIQRSSGRQVLLSTHSPDLLQDEGIGLDEVLLLEPGQEGTEVSLTADHAQVCELLEGGVSLGEAVLPQTRPRESAQLLLPFDR